MSFKPTSYPTSFPTVYDSSTIEVERAVAAFVLLGVVLGNLTGYVFENVPFPIPYHVVVFIEGVIISIALKYFLFIESFENVISAPDISNDLIVYVFLPALLFGETMNLNWHLVTSGFNQYMLLAGPGALVGGLITAVVSYYILGYGWSWQVCFLFGAVLSATDPVSVIAILKATGASNKLTTVIVGESLFNDGAAMVLFFLFYNQQKYFSNGALFFEFILQMVLGSPSIGIACGLIAHKLMRFFDSPTQPHIDIQIGITLACAYISFYVAEGPCSMSGVLSCCGAGLVISWLGSPKILDDDKMHLIWGNLEWFCNTLIFFLAGLIAGSNALDKSSLAFGQDFGFLIIMYVVVLVIRYIMIFLFYPILRSTGFSLTINEALFISFSGLRGALGISLSLIVQSNFNNSAENFFFLFAGIASLSLLINGSLAKVMINYLKLIEDPNAPKSIEMQALLKQIKLSIRVKVQNELSLIENELGNYNPTEVNRLCRLMRGSQDIGDIINSNDINKHKDFLLNINRISVDKSLKISNDILAYVRMTFLDTLRCRYWDSIRTGKLGIDILYYLETFSHFNFLFSSLIVFVNLSIYALLFYPKIKLTGRHAYSAKLLLYSIDVASDYINSDPKVGLMDWDVVDNGLKVDKFTYYCATIVDNLFHYVNIYPGFVPYFEAKRERMAIYTLTNFIDAHMFAQSKIHEYLGGEYDDEKSGQGLSAAGPEEALVRQHSMELVEKAKNLLSIIPPDDLIKFNSTRAARVILLKQLEVVENMVKTGALSEKSASLIYQSIEDDTIKVEIERQSLHKTYLQDANQRKKEEDKELRQSFRLSSPFDIVTEQSADKPTLRPSLTNQTGRLSFREFGLSSSNLNPSMSGTMNPITHESKSAEDSSTTL